MKKLVIHCCNCGVLFGSSSDGTHTTMCCPRCKADIEYSVERNKVMMEIIRHFEKPLDRKTEYKLKNYKKTIKQNSKSDSAARR